jgi:hypothetical protein
MLAGTAFAGGSVFSANGIGEQQVGGGVRTLALGGGGFALRDSMSFNSLNPGLVAFAPRTTMRMAGEVGFWNTTSNGTTDSDGEMSWRDIRLYMPLTSRWKIGAGVEPTRRQDLHTIGDLSAVFPDTAQRYEERVTWSGSTVDVKFDNAYRFSDRLGLGVSVIYSVLHNERSAIVDFESSSFQDARFNETNTFRGWALAVGGYYRFNDKLSVGGFYRPRGTGNRTTELAKSGTDSTIKTDGRADSPGEFGLGVSCKLSPSLVSVADLWMGQWKAGDYGIAAATPNGTAPRNPTFVSVGLERLARRGPLYSGFDLWSYRAGLFYRQHYWATESGDAVTDIGLSFGTSIPVAKSAGWLHWAGELGKRGMDEKKLGATETFFRFSFQVEIGETWFQRSRPRAPE